MLVVKENANNVEEFNLLYDLVGWGHYDENISINALNNTFYSVSIYDDEKIIGYGRIIGDTICFFIYSRCYGCTRISRSKNWNNE